MFRVRVVSLAMFACAGACGDDLAPPTGAADTTGAAGSGGSAEGSAGSAEATGTANPEPAFTVVFEEGGNTIALRADGATRLSLPLGRFQIGWTEAIDDALSYDPVHEMAVQWRAPTAIELPGDGSLAAVLRYDGGVEVAASAARLADGRFGLTWDVVAGAGAVAAFRFAATVDPQEGLYGLGEHFDAPDNRGRVRPMQIESDLTFEPGHNEVHVPIPLLIGTQGWGLFVADEHPGLFDCATQQADTVEVTFGVGPHADRGLQMYLLGAEDPLDITREYYELTGYPKRPAPWAVGPLLWRNENEDQAQVVDDARKLRELDLAASAMWIDRPYATGVNTFDFSAQRYPDPNAMIDEVQALGLRMGLWHTPYVSNDEEPAWDLHDEAVARGLYPPTVGVAVTNWGPVVDLTNPETWSWWQSLLRRYADAGIEGYKLDYAEEIVPGIGPARLPWRFADGSDERTMQSSFQRFYHRIYDEMLPDDGGFLLVRAGTWGDQVNASIVWPGDLDADMGTHGTIVNGRKRSGGLPAAVVAGLSLGPSGYPLFASDTGGYKGSPPNKETFTRWFQHTALTPVMQVGTASSDVAWEFNEANGFDDEMLGWYREFTRLHLRLFPYLWTHIERVAVDGRPIVRPLGLAYPELGEHPRYDYLLGDGLLVAPVVEAGATTRGLVVPPGTWLDWFSGEMLTGPGRATVDAPLDKLPLYLAEGAIVPMLRPTIDTLSPTTVPDSVDSYANDPGVLTVRIRPGGDSRFEVFDGATIVQRTDETGVAVWLRGGDTFAQGWVLELVGVEVPGAVFVDGVRLGPRGEDWTYDEASRVLVVPVAQADALVVVR